MALTEREKEWGTRASRFLKAELKRAGIGYKELADRLNKHGLEETETSRTGKLARGTFATSFFLACLAACRTEFILADDRVDCHGLDVRRSPLELFGRFD